VTSFSQRLNFSGASVKGDIKPYTFGSQSKVVETDGASRFRNRNKLGNLPSIWALANDFKGANRASPFAELRMNQVRKQFHAFDQTRSRADEVGVGVHGINTVVPNRG